MTTISDIGFANQAILLMIVPPGRAEAIAHFALQEGASCATVFSGHGTVPKRILRMLGLDEIRRELILITVGKLQTASELLHKIRDIGHFGEKDLGIAFIQPLLDLEKKEDKQSAVNLEMGTSEANYRALITIVDNGEGNTVVDIARENGAAGATIISAMGSADHSAHVFDFDINPRKDMVLLVSDKEKADSLQQALLQALSTSTPGRGIIFSLYVTETLGIMGHEDTEQLIRGSWTVTTPSPHTVLLVMVNRAKTKSIIQTCEAAGNMGATIIHGRGIRHTDKAGSFFKESFDIERNMVLMVIKKEQEEQMIQILRDLDESDPDYALSVAATYALNFSKFSEAE
ncbi:MAG: hypothetical protein GX034_03110 [Clostridiaceae bacterium]|jgi:nitrogen regulatory protein PII|nr:hypothetical protein [Clostridiaceae bacterium]